MRAYEFITEETITFTIDPMYSTYTDQHDNVHDMKYVWVNINKVDKMWQNDDLYIGKGGKNGIGNRYERFGEWLSQSDEPVKAPSIYIDDDTIRFNNGRHRFSWFRDHGYESMPVSMSNASYKIAQKLGILSV